MIVGLSELASKRHLQSTDSPCNTAPSPATPDSSGLLSTATSCPTSPWSRRVPFAREALSPQSPDCKNSPEPRRAQRNISNSISMLELRTPEGDVQAVNTGHNSTTTSPASGHARATLMLRQAAELRAHQRRHSDSCLNDAQTQNTARNDQALTRLATLMTCDLPTLMMHNHVYNHSSVCY
jgi:hypothetical protein